MKPTNDVIREHVALSKINGFRCWDGYLEGRFDHPDIKELVELLKSDGYPIVYAKPNRIDQKKGTYIHVDFWVEE